MPACRLRYQAGQVRYKWQATRVGVLVAISDRDITEEEDTNTWKLCTVVQKSGYFQVIKR